MYLKAHAPIPEYTEALRQRQVSTFLVNERKWLKHGLIKSVWTGCVHNMEDMDGLLETMIFIADHTDQHYAPGWRLYRNTGTEKCSWRYGYGGREWPACVHGRGQEGEGAGRHRWIGWYARSLWVLSTRPITDALVWDDHAPLIGIY